MIVTSNILPEVSAILEDLGDRVIWGENWKGLGGLTDRSVYVALLRKAYHHGRLIPVGLRVSISMRNLALEAGVSLPTANRAVQRLTLERGLIRRDGYGEGPNSGAFVLLSGARPELTLLQKSLLKSTISSTALECLTRARLPLRWGAERLGKTNELILDAIRRLGRQATLDELARLTRRRARDLKRRQIRTLVEAGLIVEQRENFYELHCDFGWNLEFERVYSGEKDAEDRDRRNYKKQRDEFREAWGRGEVTSSKPNSRGSK